MNATTLAKLEHKLRLFLTRLPPRMATSIYSRGRQYFLKKLDAEEALEGYIPPPPLERKLWGITFRGPLMNAAGMFKNGECYEMVAKQGAGAYLGGTTTWNPRSGNKKEGIYCPFIPYPQSNAASNWLGLPNDGDEVNARRVQETERINGCPFGWSVARSPDLDYLEGLEKLIQAMKLYEKAEVDFLELNESCPNTSQGSSEDYELASRLHYIKTHFLDERSRRLPVIVKFSNDTRTEKIHFLLDMLFNLGFDGINVGNTSTQYQELRKNIDPREHKLYDFFTKTFGGGISGNPLKEPSKLLGTAAVWYLHQGPPSQEFHVIRTGGIENVEDIRDSEAAGVALNQWFTGYFKQFTEHGHDVYREFYSDAALPRGVFPFLGTGGKT